MSATCRGCASELEPGDLRCVVCALAVPVAASATDAPRAGVLRCGTCHAPIAFSAEADAPRCAFCGATMVVPDPTDATAAPALRVPFLVGRDGARVALRRWLGQRGRFAPSSLAAEAVLDAPVAVYWAGWIVSARARVTWTADSDAGAGEAEWSAHAGEHTMAFDAVCVPASRGLAVAECEQLIPHHALSRAVPFEGTAGSRTSVAITDPPPVVEQFAAQRAAIRASVMRGLEDAAEREIRPRIPGSRFRNVHVALRLERLTTARVALPAWVLVYRYRGAAHRVIVHGERPDVVVGSSPKDPWKIAVAILATLAAIAAIVWFARWTPTPP